MPQGARTKHFARGPLGGSYGPANSTVSFLNLLINFGDSDGVSLKFAFSGLSSCLVLWWLSYFEFV